MKNELSWIPLASGSEAIEVATGGRHRDNQKTSDGDEGARFRFCTESRELRTFHTGRGSSFNLSAEIAQKSRDIEIGLEHGYDRF